MSCVENGATYDYNFYKIILYQYKGRLGHLIRRGGEYDHVIKVNAKV
jgi:hypothetical protein